MSTTAAASPAAATSQSPADGSLSHRQILVVLSGLMLGILLAALDQMIVATSIRTISDDLHGLNLQAWATTAYLITSTISTPLYGKLSDQYGRKPFFLFAISVFMLGSLACTFSTSMYMLAAFRAVQGIGAGGLMSLALAILGDIVGPRERAKYTGYFMAVFGTSSVAGPVIGGALAGQAHILGIDGWRWVFLVNVPIGIIALTVVAKVLNLPRTPVTRHRLDWSGALALVIGLVPLLIVAEQGHTWGWDSAKSLLCFVVGGIGLIAFLFVQHRMGNEALIPLRLFRSGVFRVSIGVRLLVGVAMFGAMSMIPQFLQIVRGASPTKSGLLMLPFMVGLMLFAAVSGQITSRTGHYKIFPIIGALFMLAAALLFYFRINADMPLWETDIYMAIFGGGLGLNMQTLQIAAQNAVPPRDMGVATSTSTTAQQLGGTIGTAVFLSMMFSLVGTRIGNAFSRAFTDGSLPAALRDPRVLSDPQSASVARAIAAGPAGISQLAAQVTENSSFLQRIDPRLAHPFFVGFSNSISVVFLCAAAITFVAFVLALFMKELPLRSMSGLQARMAEEKDAAVTVIGAEDTRRIPAVRRISTGGEAVVATGVIGNGHGQPGRPRYAGTVAVMAGPDEGKWSAENGYLVAGLQRKAGARLMAGASTGSGFIPPQAAGAPIHGRVRRADGSGIGESVLTLIDLGGRQIGRGVAGPDGRYRLETPGGGTYVVIASAGAHQPEASTVVVGAGPVEMDIVLSGTSGITGTVTVGGSGAPLSGATTTLADGRGEVVAAQRTGPDGGYAFTELVSGTYTLVVSADSYRPSARTVTVPSTGQAHYDVELIGGARLHGIARSAATSRPVPDVRVTLLDAAGNVVGATNTDDSGGYSFGDLAEGEYTVIASGYPPVAGNLRVVGGKYDEHNVELGHPEV